jgi:hypothetical protein
MHKTFEIRYYILSNNKNINFIFERIIYLIVNKIYFQYKDKYKEVLQEEKKVY